MKPKKFPRILHCPWSESSTSDDVWLDNCDHFKGKEVVVTLKIDGENCNIAHNFIHARSMDGRDGVGRSWVKALHGSIKHDIPDNLRICGENVYAAHSIWYHNLETYFYVFGIFEEDKNGVDQCLDWDSTKEIADCLGLKTIPEIYRGIYDEKIIRSKWIDTSIFETFNTPEDHQPIDNPIPTSEEGYVVRLVSGFSTQNFSQSCLKYVRSNHVQTSAHWTSLPVLPNRLRP